MSKKAQKVQSDSGCKGIQGNTSKAELKCVCLNTRSIINKKNELDIMVDEIKPHIIGITESWANNDITRGRPWRYSVIPSTPDFPTEYQIRRHSNPAGLPTFAAIWGPDFRASIIRLTCPHVFIQIKKNNYFDDDVQSQSSPTKLRRPTVIGMQRRGTRAYGHRRLLVVYSARGFLARIVCFEGATPAFQSS